MESLLKKLEERSALIGVMGLGYVGLPLAVLFAEAGFPVLGFESELSKREALRKGSSYIKDIPSERLKAVAEPGHPAPGRLACAESFSELAGCDAIIICVPTPLAKSKDPDLSFIIDAAKLVRAELRPGQLIVLESTTYPGTTRELVLPILLGFEPLNLGEPLDGEALKNASLAVGKDFFLAFSPERVDPGNPSFGITNTPKVMGGVTPTCSKAAALLYSSIVERVVPVSSTDAAEMTKLLENTFRLINIGLVNEFSIICRKLGVDVWEVIDAASTKPFGFIPFYPGPGLGGHCIPVDPLYLSWKMRLQDYRARFIELASEINGHMPAVVVERVTEALNSVRKSCNGSKVALMGAAYKKDIDDVRESPALDVLSLLRKKGCQVSYYDPYVAKLQLTDGGLLESADFSPRWLAAQDCVVLITDHTRFDLQAVCGHAQLIVDTRNLIERSGFAGTCSNRLFKL